MTRIAEARVHSARIPLLRPFTTAVRTTRHIDVVLVQLTDSDGRSGWGEAPTIWRVTGESETSVRAAVEGPLAETVIGLPVDEPNATADAIGRAVARNTAAKMAVECAAWDLAAHAADLPLWQLLRGTTGALTTDMTLSAPATDAEIDSVVARAVGHVAEGFHTLKFKTGAGADDARLLREVRDAVGADVTLRIDANQAWDGDTAIRIIRGWEYAGVGIQLVEQPVAADDIAALARVTAEVSTPVLADEAVWSPRDARQVIRERAADLINIKLAKTGGIQPALEVASIAHDAGIGVLVGSMMESVAGIAAAAAVASTLAAGGAVPAGFAHDLDAGSWLAESPVTGGVHYDGERVYCSTGTGLGIRTGW